MWAKRYEAGCNALAEPAFGRCSHEPRQDASAQEQPNAFRLRPHRDAGGDEIDRPQQFVLPDILGRELVGTDGDNADDRGADAVKGGLHPGQTTVAHVSPADGEHHKKGWQDKRNADHRGAHDAEMHVPEIHGELRSQRTGHELRQRQSFLVVVVGDPMALLDEIAIHVSNERYRTTEANAAQLEEVERKLG